MRLRLPVLLLLAALALPAGAMAQLAPSSASSSLSMVGVRLHAPASPDGLGDRLGRLAFNLLDAIGLGDTGLGRLVFDPVAIERRNTQVADDFAWLMDIAGYKLKEIESSVALIPKIVMTFGQARELTEGDRNYLERQLERHAQRNPGPLAAIQRAIVRAVADASELGAFEVDKVKVNLLPLPKVRFMVAPAAAPLGMEAARLMRALDRVGAQLREIEIAIGPEPAPEVRPAPAPASAPAAQPAPRR